MTPAGMSVLLTGAPERFLGFPEALAVRLNSAFPAWLDRAFGRHGAVLRALARQPTA